MKAYENYKNYSHATCFFIYSHAFSVKSMGDCIISKFQAKSKIKEMFAINTEILITILQ